MKAKEYSECRVMSVVCSELIIKQAVLILRMQHRVLPVSRTVSKIARMDGTAF